MTARPRKMVSRKPEKRVSTLCQRRGCHDWGTGPGKPAPLRDSEVQTCVDCKTTRFLSPKGVGVVYR